MKYNFKIRKDIKMKNILCLLMFGSLVLAGCESVETESAANYPQSRGGEIVYTQDKPDSVLGEDGLTLFGGNKKRESSNGATLAVNKYLWQATLETLSFMPIQAADPFGGTVITDWYQPDVSKDERLKTQVFITSAELRASSIRAQVFRQVKKGGEWVKADTAKDTNVKMEDAILAKAREIRIREKNL